MFCYSENDGKMSGSFSIPYDKQPANNFYLNHYKNYLYINFVAGNEFSTTIEKMQAQKELKICERKMKHWERHPNFDVDFVATEVTKLKKDWS